MWERSTRPARQNRRRLQRTADGAAGDGIGDIAASVGQGAGVGEKQIARPDLAAVVGDAGVRPRVAAKSRNHARRTDLAVFLLFSAWATLDRRVRTDAQGAQAPPMTWGKTGTGNVAAVVGALPVGSSIITATTSRGR